MAVAKFFFRKQDFSRMCRWDMETRRADGPDLHPRSCRLSIFFYTSQALGIRAGCFPLTRGCSRNRTLASHTSTRSSPGRNIEVEITRKYPLESWQATS